MANVGSPLLLIIYAGVWGICCVDATTSWRWCCTSRDAYFKCKRVAQNVFNGDQQLPITCVQRSGNLDCVAAIKSNDADVMIIHSHYIYLNLDGLAVVGHEDYGMGDAGYYAVAAVKAGNDDISLCNLNGAKTCHTGVYKSSGWNTPMGTLTRHHSIATGETRFHLYDPFEASCAPGANNPSYTSKLPRPTGDDPNDFQKWCKLCVGNNETEPQHVCDRDNDELFYGYEGALRCLLYGGGDIAFTKNTVLPKINPDKLNILCRNGSRAHPSDWKTCNLARIPARGMIMREGSTTNANELVQALEDARQNWNYLEFQQDGLLWARSAKAFRSSNHYDTRAFLGEDYYCNMKAVHGDIILESDGCSVDPLQCPETE